jgi:hypothetical protein
VGSVSAANVVSNAQLVANLANYPILTSGNLNLSANLSVNVNFTVGNSTNYLQANTSGFYPVSNTLTNALGATTKRWATYSTTINASGLITGTAGLTITGTTNTSIGFNAGGSSSQTTGTGGLIANATTIQVGNNTINTKITSAGLTINGTAVVANSSGVFIGASTNAANGYTALPNGFKMNWGWVSANSSAGDVTFSSSFTTNAYNVTATSNTSVATYQASVIGTNNTIAQIRTANATSTNVFWQAIGY